MEWIRSITTKIPSLHSDCDISDRLNCTITVSIICVLSASVTMKQIIGDAISCFTPNDFSGAQSKYVENFCWVMNTYYLPGVDVPKNVEDRQDAEIGYYQWIPYILLLQALLFYLPYFIWTVINWQSGIHVSKVVNMAVDVENWKHGEEEGLVTLANYLNQLFRFRKRASHSCCGNFKLELSHMCMYCGKRYGNVLIIVYFFIKLLYLANIFGQLFLIHNFLDVQNYTFWGAQALMDLVNRRYWHESGMFPRLTLCDFEIRRYANVHRHTVQCVLPINLFSEKIYIFLWFWCCLLAIVSAVNIFTWSYRMLLRRQRVHFVKTYLRMMDEKKTGKKFKVDLAHFVEQHLCQDGVLLIRLIVCSAGDIIAARLLERLWKLWQSQRGRQRSEEVELEERSNDFSKRLTLRMTSPTTSNTSNRRGSNEDNAVVSNV